MKSTRDWVFLFFGVGLRMPRHSLLNAAAFVTECCGIEVSDFTPISSKCLNVAALGTQCCGIEYTDFQNFFLVQFECCSIEL